MRIQRAAIPCLVALLLLLCACSDTPGRREAETVLSWSGEVVWITEFRDGALPAGIEAGDRITGSIRFDQSAYDSSSTILGNVSAGTRYRYVGGLDQVVVINDWEWELDSGTVSMGPVIDLR